MREMLESAEDQPIRPARTVRPVCPVATRARWKRVGAATAATALAVGMFAAGCAKNDTNTAADASTGTIARTDQGVVENAEKPVSGGKIVYGLRAETNGWNPGTNQWAASGLQVAHALFDTMTSFDDSGEIHPFLAAGFDHDATYTHWTIRLRPNITLQNGKAVDSKVVLRNLEYLKKSPIVGSVFTYVDSYATDGPDKVTMTLKEPWVTVPMAFASQVGVIADPDWLESNDSLHPIGTGPFSLDEWQIGNKLTVKKNPTYWQKDKDGTPYPYLDSIEFRVITDAASRTTTLQSGGADIIELNEAPQILTFKDDNAGFQVFSNNEKEGIETMVMLNNEAAPFDDPDARRALAYATDQKTFNEVDNEGLWTEADGPFEPGSPWYTPTGYPKYDPVKAKELVEKVKASHGGTFSFGLKSIGEPAVQKAMQILQQQWQDVGIDVSVESEEQSKLIIEVVSGKYQSVLWQQFDAPHPLIDSIWVNPDLNRPVPEFSLNFPRISDPVIGDALKDARATTDHQKEVADYQTVAKQLAIDVPYVWLNHNQFTIVASPRLVNVMNWTLPDGAKGIQMAGEAHSVFQIWLRP